MSDLQQIENGKEAAGAPAESPVVRAETRSERYGRTQKKTLTLTREAIEAIEAWSEAHDLYFSVAIETLAMVGLGRRSVETLPRLVTNLLERTLNRQFNRFAKLLSLAAIAAEEANWKADALLLQHIWREARQDPEGFMDNMTVSVDPADRPAAQTRRLRDQLRKDAHEEAVQRLKQPLAANDVLLERDGEEPDGD
jgi:hypothetical protein